MLIHSIKTPKSAKEFNPSWESPLKWNWGLISVVVWSMKRARFWSAKMKKCIKFSINFHSNRKYRAKKWLQIVNIFSLKHYVFSIGLLRMSLSRHIQTPNSIKSSFFSLSTIKSSNLKNLYSLFIFFSLFTWFYRAKYIYTYICVYKRWLNDWNIIMHITSEW